jgi:endonuclease YncB( thermonuclease family)
MARIPFRRRSGGASRVGAADARITLWIGAILGLLYFDVGRWMAPSPDRFDWATAHAPDPWAESRESGQSLRGQEKAPPSARAEDGERTANGSGEQNPASGETVRSEVRVVDGDTFRAAGETIRIADIDTPETHPPRCAYEAKLGARATRRLQALLAQGPFELERIDRDTDRYGRKLRVVTRGGRSLGDVLVAEGLARTWTGRREPWCA